ncbi:hypothetical protein HDU67_007905 [Dinochytrium kinnereticum]|nr:hypothetical protein HDU67_007905 [Dinochytrium kinnereticum]
MKTVIIFGASRGIGAAIAKRLAVAGYHVVVTAKTSSTAPNNGKQLPGTIESVRDEIIAAGGSASCSTCDVRDPDRINAVIQETIKTYGGVDAVIYNAGAIFWASVKDTPFKRFNLMQEVNIRGCYAAVASALPHFRSRGFGRFLLVSPPIYSRFFRGKTAYAIGKVGMSVLTMGLAMELEGSDIAVTSIWPATGIQAAVTDVQNTDPSLLRKPEIFADASLLILEAEAKKVNGKTFLDEDYLREYHGITDFTKYRLNPEAEPPRMMPKEFPSLLVAEQDDRGVFMKKGSPPAKL